MSDIEKLAQTFSELGIEFTIKEYDDIQIANYDGEARYNARIKLQNGVGYYGFNCKFYFLDSKCTGHGVWE